jgi:hypothetical protein
MEVGTMPRKTMEGRLLTGRRKGRPRLRWKDDVVVDLRLMKIKQWTEKTEDRELWRLVVEEAKGHPVLYLVKYLYIVDSKILAYRSMTAPIVSGL